MKSIDKNNVDLSKLYNWGRETALLDEAGKEVLKLYVRLVGDSELNRSRVFALRESATLRKQLNKKDSDEALAYIPQFSIIEDENLVEAILANQVRSITTDVIRDLDFNLPVEPRSDAPLEKMEEYQETVDNWPTKRNKEISNKVTKILATERERVSKMSRKEKERIFSSVLIDSLCEEEMYKKFNEMCIYFGTFADEEFKERAFETFEDYDRLPVTFKKQLQLAYDDLDISLDDLKK